MDLKPYVCKQCGGKIDVARMRCEYCGTEYHDESLKRLVISTVRPGQSTIRAEVRLDRDIVARCPERARDYALSELRNQLADGLLAYMKIQTSENFDPMYMGRCEAIRGEVRVIDPSFDYDW